MTDPFEDWLETDGGRHAYRMLTTFYYLPPDVSRVILGSAFAAGSGDAWHRALETIKSVPADTDGIEVVDCFAVGDDREAYLSCTTWQYLEDK